MKQNEREEHEEKVEEWEKERIFGKKKIKNDGINKDRENVEFGINEKKEENWRGDGEGRGDEMRNANEMW